MCEYVQTHDRSLIQPTFMKTMTKPIWFGCVRWNKTPQAKMNRNWIVISWHHTINEDIYTLGQPNGDGVKMFRICLLNVITMAAFKLVVEHLSFEIILISLMCLASVASVSNWFKIEMKFLNSFWFQTVFVSIWIAYYLIISTTCSLLLPQQHFFYRFDYVIVSHSWHVPIDASIEQIQKKWIRVYSFKFQSFMNTQWTYASFERNMNLMHSSMQCKTAFKVIRFFIFVLPVFFFHRFCFAQWFRHNTYI